MVHVSVRESLQSEKRRLSKYVSESAENMDIVLHFFFLKGAGNVCFVINTVKLLCNFNLTSAFHTDRGISFKVLKRQTNSIYDETIMFI